MVDLSKIGKSLGADPLAAANAAQASEDIRKKQKKELSRTRGLGLEDIPEEKPYVPIDDAQEVLDTGEVQASNVLDKVDQELAKVQEEIKNFIAKKIKLADKNEDKRHELLISAFEDCKNAYLKVKQVREILS